MKNKPITVWEKFNIKSQKWNHSHIENGHITANKPIGTTIQTKSWNDSTWIYKHLYITKDYKIVNEEKEKLRNLFKVTMLKILKKLKVFLLNSLSF